MFRKTPAKICEDFLEVLLEEWIVRGASKVFLGEVLGKNVQGIPAGKIFDGIHEQIPLKNFIKKCSDDSPKES